MSKEFQEWWKSLTIVERRVLGPNAAKFVWDAAFKAGQESAKKQEK
jgi:hypothetical protein